MTCPLCGKASSCVHTRRNTSALVDHQADGIFAADFAGNEKPLAQPAPAIRAVAGEVRPAADPAWRREIVSRVQQHRARRRRPVDPNAMELDFPAEGPHSFGVDPDDALMSPPPERFHEIVIPQNMVKPVMGRPEPPKVIRFPRTQPAYVPTVEEVMLDELEQAAPAPESPRIMEAYDAEPMDLQQQEMEPLEIETVAKPSLQGQQMELLPNFDDIHLEPEQERIDHDDEVIPRPAPIQQRMVAGAVDVAIVFLATGVFGLTFMEVAEQVPHSSLTMVCMLATGGIFWLVFQYIFLVYRRATPGMNFAGLELCTFEGKATTMFERQCRAAASALSGFSMGLGYFWALVDEDRVGWHDRISQTHVRASHIPSIARERYDLDDFKCQEKI